MAKKKNDTVEKETNKVDFSDKTVADVYTGLVVLDTKLDTLIELLQKVVDIADKKSKGTNTYM